MPSMLTVILFLCASAGCLADDISGPNHTTIRQTAWGSLFYDPLAMGPHQFETKLDEVRIKSGSGEVKILGSDANGYRLSHGQDLLTIKTNVTDLDIRWKEKSWTLRVMNGRYTLATSVPKDTIVFERNANTFTIKGLHGFVSVHSNPGLLSIRSSVGSASVSSDFGNRSFTGVALDQIPYLGRGLYISFHGVGLLIDMAKLFPMPEIFEWNRWKPITGPSFDPHAR